MNRFSARARNLRWVVGRVAAFILFLSSALVLVLPAALSAETLWFRCKGVDARSRAVIFTCSGHEVRRGKNTVSAEIVYRTAKGKVFAKEKINYRKDKVSPDILFIDERDGRREMVERGDSVFTIVTQESKTAAPAFTKVKLPGSDYAALTIPGLPGFLTENFRDKPVDTRIIFYCVFPLEKKLLRLRATNEATIKYRGQEALRLRLQPDNFVYRWFSDPVRLTINRKSGRLLRYEGLHYIRDPRSGHGSIVDLSFTW